MTEPSNAAKAVAREIVGPRPEQKSEYHSKPSQAVLLHYDHILERAERIIDWHVLAFREEIERLKQEAERCKKSYLDVAFMVSSFNRIVSEERDAFKMDNRKLKIEIERLKQQLAEAMNQD